MIGRGKQQLKATNNIKNVKYLHVYVTWMKKVISIFNGYKPEVITPYQFKQNPVKYKTKFIYKLLVRPNFQSDREKGKYGYVNICTGIGSES